MNKGENVSSRIVVMDSRASTFYYGTVVGSLFCIASFVLGRVAYPNPEITLPLQASPTITVDLGDLVQGDFRIDPDTGFPIRLPDGSTVPEEQFREDCVSVCADRGRPDHPGRVLYMEPEHLVCVCVAPGSSFPVTRYVAWELTR